MSTSNDDERLDALAAATHEEWWQERQAGGFIDPELYQLLKARAKGELPNVPWRANETARQRAERWNAAWPNDPIPVPEDDE